MKSVTTKHALEALIQNTYITAVIFMLIAVLIAFIIASVIKWQGYPDYSYRKRRIWWIIVGIAVPLIFWIINAAYVSSFIDKSSWIGKFGTCNVIATCSCIAAYFILSIVTMLIFRSSKWGSILGPTKNK